VSTREAQVHDFRDAARGWGHDLCYEPLPGQRLKATGWGHGLEGGDFMLLTNGAADTRYRIDEVEYIGGMGGPKDMWSAVLSFAPREASDG
jgi:hypothetical protein